MTQDPIQKIGKYEIVEELGRGAMGIVYKARDPLIGRLVALKTVTPGLLTDLDLLKRFYREAQSAGKLQHPNIVVIHDLGESDGLPYIAMELVEGESLQKTIARRAPMPLAQKLRMMVQLCHGLGYAHQHGVVHRDVKPANILVKPDGTVKVVDFGIVHLTDTGMTASGTVLGTVSYMSPEQLRGEHVDARSDIFSVGVVMYELLSYQKPFDGPNIPAIMLKIASEDPAPLGSLVPGIPSALEQAVGKCLRKDSEERFQNLDDLAFELEPLARELQRGVVDGMIEQGREFLAQGEFARAEEVLRSALALDSSHDVAKALMAKAQTELRRLKISARVQLYMDEGRHLLDQGKYAEAGQAFEEVLRLDSQHGQARGLLQAAREALAKAAEVHKRLLEAKRAVSEGDLTLAESELGKALVVDAEHTEVVSLLDKIREERAARERRLRLREGVSSARDMLRQERYEEALGQIEMLHKEFPQEAEVKHLLATARQKIEQQQQLRKAFSEVKALLEQQRFKEAIDLAETVRFQFPQETESSRLYEFARTEHSLAERRQRLEFEVTALQEQIKAQEYDAALERGERLQREFPASVELARLVMLARSERQAVQREKQIKEARMSVQTLWDAGKLEEAARAAETALASFPEDLALNRLCSAIRDQLERQRAAKPVDADSMVEAVASATQIVAGTPSEEVAPTGVYPDETGRSASAELKPGLIASAAGSGSPAIEVCQPRQDVHPAVAQTTGTQSPDSGIQELWPPVPEEQSKPPWRSRLTLVAATVLVAALGGAGYVLLHKPRPQPASRQVPAPPSASPMRPAPSATTAAGVVAGRVADDAGAAIAGVRVTASAQSGKVSDSTSAADGSFRLEKLESGSYVIRAEAPTGYSPPPEARIELSKSQERRIDISLTRPAALRPETVGNMGPASGASTPAKGSSAVGSRQPAKQAASLESGRAVQKQASTVATERTGQLVVSANVTGARIIIDGKDSGEVTPHTFPALPARSHTVAVMKEGSQTASSGFVVQAGDSVTANLQLVPPTVEPGELEFITEPPGVEVFIDDKSYGPSPVTTPLAPGVHTYSVKKGRQVKTGSFKVGAGSFFQKKITFGNN